MDSEKKSKEVGSRIKNLRKKMGISQENLGDILNLCQNSISKLENGKTQLTLNNQVKLVEYFNVSHDYLCNGIDDASLLNVLKKYFSLEYKTFHNGEETLKGPVLRINKAFFDFLIHTAHIQNDKYMPDDIQKKWLKIEDNKFYENNKEISPMEYTTVVPLPEELLFPSDEKEEWKQSDLLREVNKHLLDNSITTNE